MNHVELAEMCAERISDGSHHIDLTISGPPPKGARIRLDRKSRRKCPMGEICSWLDNPPRTVAEFDPVEVLAWLAASGLVQVKATVGTSSATTAEGHDG